MTTEYTMQLSQSKPMKTLARFIKQARLNGKTLTEFVTALFVCVTIRMGWGTKQIIAFGGCGTGMCLMEMGFDGNLY